MAWDGLDQLRGLNGTPTMDTAHTSAGNHYKSMMVGIDNSLRRLQTSYVDIY